MDTCSTKNPGVFHVNFFMCIIGVDLHVDIKWSLSLIFFHMYSTLHFSCGLLVYIFMSISHELFHVG